MTTAIRRNLAALRNARQGFPRVLGSPGAAGAIPGLGAARAPFEALDPDHYPPRDSIGFDVVSSSTTVAAGVTAVLCTVTIPMGSRGILKDRLLALPIDEDPTKWPNLTWTVAVNGSPLAPLGAQVFPMGTGVADSIHARLEPGSVVTLSVTNALLAADCNCIGRLKGWSYPQG